MENTKYYVNCYEGCEIEKKTAEKDFKKALWNEVLTQNFVGKNGKIEYRLREGDTIEKDVLDNLFNTLEEAKSKMGYSSFRLLNNAYKYYDIEIANVYSLEISNDPDENGEFEIIKIECETSGESDLIEEFNKSLEDEEED